MNSSTQQLKYMSGFTLIELAIVIIIVGILAAVGFTKLFNLTGSSEQAVILDFRQQLISAASAYTLAQGITPNGFTDFVDTNPVSQGARTISVARFGTNAQQSPCQPAATAITCNGTFNQYPTVQYLWNNGEITISGI